MNSISFNRTLKQSNLVMKTIYTLEIVVYKVVEIKFKPWFRNIENSSNLQIKGILITIRFKL